MRTLAVGEVDGECIVAAANETDQEGGYVAIRQPLTADSDSRPLDADLERTRVLGVGLATREAAPSPGLVLMLDGVGAIDPLTGQVVAASPEAPAVELVSGAWRVPALIEQSAPRIPGAHGRGRGFVLRRDRPLQWPVRCEAWATIGGRLLQARGSYAGTAWVIHAGNGEIVAGPFRDVADTTQVWTM